MNVTDITSSCVSFLETPQPAPPVVTLSVELTIIAGGGGGGGLPIGQVGGGGAGGYIYRASLPIEENITYPIVVATAVGYRTQGGNSSAFGLTALGGGYGAGPNNGDLPSAGGSGGGGNSTASSSRIGGLGTQLTSASGGYGNQGGDGWASLNGAGGGGASTAGGPDYNPPVSREYGGDGFGIYVNNAFVFVCGGGGSRSTTTGIGGGSNCFGGGGHGGFTTVDGNGGPGAVVFSYPDVFPAATVTGSPSIVVTGGYRRYTFLSSGSVLIP